MEQAIRKNFEQALRRHIRGDVYFDDVTRGLYATDASICQIMPVAVVVPRDEPDVHAAIRAAAHFEVSVVPRGAATSLAGQTVGPSLVIDFSKYMNKIVELNVEERWVRVQPGIVLDELNAKLAEQGLMFAPDPATSNRATIGGMMGNNASGSKSLLYGKTSDHVLAARVLLSDGTVLEISERAASEFDRPAVAVARGTRETEILAEFKNIIEANKAEIKKRFPKVMRRVSGYSLDSFVGDDRWNLIKLLIGSEGTLGIFLEAKLNLEPLPKYKALCAIHFNDPIEAVEAVTTILRSRPAAVEIFDDDVIGPARKNLSIAPMCGFIQGDPAAILVVEFFTQDEAAAKRKCQRLAKRLEERKIGYAWPVITDPGEQANVWAVRKNGLGLVLGVKSRRKPMAFIEDACVPVKSAPQYVAKVLDFCKERDISVAMYGHASVGTIHIRPILDLKDGGDIEHMKAIMDFAFDLVGEYGGSLSGEHGDGRVRSPFLERYFGSEIYQAFQDIKTLFDPDGMLNPGVIVDSPGAMDTLRYGTDYQTPSEPTEYHYRQDGSFAAAVEMCNGVGACRQKLTGTMCPSYRATSDEEASTRGRANALRLAMTGQLGPDALTGKRLFEVMELCLSCKSCKSECPSNVDMARLKSEFLQRYHDINPRPLREKLVAGSPAMARLIAGRKALLVNLVQNTKLFRKVLEWVAGFDSRRKLPKYAFTPFPRWFKQNLQPDFHRSKRIVLFDDTYMNYHDTDVGISAVKLLRSCDYEVTRANAGCCQRPRISHGFLREAKTEGLKTLQNLDAFIQEGLKIVVCEPACYSALTDDLPDLIDDEALGRRIKDNVMMIDEFLAWEIEEGRLDVEFTSPYKRILIHGHCHQKALNGTTAMKSLLDRVPEISVTEIDTGCCGMAGSFGHEKEHYEISMQIGEERLFPAVRNRQEGTTVVACGFSCRQQITDGTDAKPVHWVQTLRGPHPS